MKAARVEDEQLAQEFFGELLGCKAWQLGEAGRGPAEFVGVQRGMDFEIATQFAVRKRMPGESAAHLVDLVNRRVYRLVAVDGALCEIEIDAIELDGAILPVEGPALPLSAGRGDSHHGVGQIGPRAICQDVQWKLLRCGLWYGLFDGWSRIDPRVNACKLNMARMIFVGSQNVSSSYVFNRLSLMRSSIE